MHELEVASVALDELRLHLTDDLLESRLAAGDATAVVDALEAAAAAPLRERTALLLVRALAAAGRTAEAMEAAHGFRRRLVEETGLDPTPELAALEQLVASGAVAPPATDAPGSLGPTARWSAAGTSARRCCACSAPTASSPSPGPAASARPAWPWTSPPAGRSPRSSVVALGAVARPERVAQAVASRLGLRLTGEVRADDVALALAERRLLLVLDNGEHVVDACRELVVARAPRRRRRPGAGHLARHPPGAGRVRRPPAAAAGAARGHRPRRVAPAAGRARVRRARAPAHPGLRPGGGGRRRPRGGAAPAGRAAARHRARRTPGRGDADAGRPRAAGPRPRPGHGAVRAGGRPAADPARQHRVVVRAARRARAAAAAGARRVPGRRRPGHRRGPRRRGRGPARPAARAGRRVVAGGGRGQRALPRAVHRACLPHRHARGAGGGGRGATDVPEPVRRGGRRDPRGCPRGRRAGPRPSAAGRARQLPGRPRPGPRAWRPRHRRAHHPRRSSRS